MHSPLSFNACKTPTERLAVSTLLDTGLRVPGAESV